MLYESETIWDGSFKFLSFYTWCARFTIHWERNNQFILKFKQFTRPAGYYKVEFILIILFVIYYKAKNVNDISFFQCAVSVHSPRVSLEKKGECEQFYSTIS